MSLKKELPALICLILALALFCNGALTLLMPQRKDFGATWGMYSKEKKNTIDIMFYGSSLAYCDIIPSEIYKETGIATYIMAGPEQTMPITYRYLSESLKTQSPKTVFIEATGMLYKRSNRSLKANLMYMPWGLNRLIPTLQETDGEEQMELLFPLYSYHDRWDKLDDKAFENISGYDADPLAGYTFLTKVTPLSGITERKFTKNAENYERNLKYAKKMADLCSSENIKLVFFISPIASRMSTALDDKLRSDLTGLGAEFVDFNDDFDKLSIDFSTDFYDECHFNCLGAEKFSKYLAEKLTEWGYEKTENSDEELWKTRIEYYDTQRKSFTLPTAN